MGGVAIVRLDHTKRRKIYRLSFVRNGHEQDSSQNSEWVMPNEIIPVMLYHNSPLMWFYEASIMWITMTLLAQSPV